MQAACRLSCPGSDPSPARPGIIARGISIRTLPAYSMQVGGVPEYPATTGILILLLVPVFVFVSGPDGLVQGLMVGIIFLWVGVPAVKLHVAGRAP